MKIVLASSSESRKNQLKDLKFKFIIHPSDLDESLLKQKTEHPKNICQKLAKAKVEKIAKNYPNDLILGGDQIAALGHQIFDKPLTKEKAVQTLIALQGKTHQLFTGLHMQYGKKQFSHLEVHTLQMRSLSQQEIKNYVQIAKPLTCAGSYALERHGIALFEKISTEDYSGIIGFPLVTLLNQLRKWDIPIPCLKAAPLIC